MPASHSGNGYIGLQGSHGESCSATYPMLHMVAGHHARDRSVFHILVLRVDS